jgi:tubulin-specific chaperone D
MEPLLSAMERAAQDTEVVFDDLGNNQVPWQERYVLLLWLSHLFLAPFDLASISTLEAEATGEIKDLTLPLNLPGIPKRIIPICLKYIKTPTRERKAATALMVRMSLRPDMRGLGLLGALAHWGITYFESSVPRSTSDLYESLGMLQFLSGLVASGNKEEVGRFAPKIFHTCQAIIQDDTHEFLQSSAIARKLVVKIIRNIAVLSMQTVDGLDAAEVIEEVIGFLLESVADGDSPVRTSSSKALSVITLQLDSSMAGEVLETILGSMTEDVLWDGSTRDLSAVDPLRWHGLTLTLSHLLYRRALPPEKLPEIINALLLALTFEQRSSTRSLIGTTVRDAANFGIWAISRRYTTKELLTVETSAIRAAHQGKHKLSVMQMLALELLQSACLDPIGNIRRGSSAALQELIGRHPDTVVQGIPLVQIVDYHAVGLRGRAICAVAFEASKLDRLYWDAMFDALQDWRGIGATDSPSRLFAAEAIGLLSTLKDFANVQEMVKAILAQLSKTGHREVEERHGLLLALSTMITQVLATQQAAHPQTPEFRHQLSQNLADLAFFVGLDFMKILPSDPEFYRSPTLRPDLTAFGVLALIRSICSAETEYLKFAHSPHGVSSFGDMLPLLELCLGRSETSVLALIPQTVKSYVLIGLDRSAVIRSTAAGWLEQLLQHSQTSSRASGRVYALGVVYSILAARNFDTGTILQTLVARCTEGEIDARVVALQSLEIVLKDLPKGCEAYDYALEVIAEVLMQALNDYTINERGDVGSLVRLEALSVASVMAGPLHEVPNLEIQAYVLRLSLEKLDKVRLKAATSDANITPR